MVNLRAVLCRQLHAFSVKAAVGANVFVRTAFLDIYAKSELIEKASCILKVVSFCAGNQIFTRRAPCCLLEGRKWGLMQSVYDINSGALIEGLQVHAIVRRTGFG